MTADQSQKLLDRATADAAFLARLIASPKAVAKELGIELKADEAATLAAMTPEDFAAFAQEQRAASDPAKRRAAC